MERPAWTAALWHNNHILHPQGRHHHHGVPTVDRPGTSEGTVTIIIVTVVTFDGGGGGGRPSTYCPRRHLYTRWAGCSSIRTRPLRRSRLTRRSRPAARMVNASMERQRSSGSEGKLALSLLAIFWGERKLRSPTGGWLGGGGSESADPTCRLNWRCTVEPRHLPNAVCGGWGEMGDLGEVAALARRADCKGAAGTPPN